MIVATPIGIQEGGFIFGFITKSLYAAGTCPSSALRQNTVNDVLEEEPTAIPDDGADTKPWEEQNPSILGSAELGCKDQSWGAVFPRATDTLAPDQLCWQRLLMAAQCLLLEEGSTSWTEGHHLSEWPKFGIRSSHPLLLKRIPEIQLGFTTQ